MTLTEFLLARIREDKAELDRARSRWMHGDDSFYRREGGQQFNPDDMRVDVGYGRALAECEAKRLAVEQHPLDDDGFCYDSTTHLRGCQWLHPCPTLRALATVYADHPDYRSEWKP